MEAEMARVLYTAEATVTGGRQSGHGRTNDGTLDVQLRSPKEMGGEGGGTNPEQLFAVGYAACFESALGVVGRRAPGMPVLQRHPGQHRRHADRQRSRRRLNRAPATALLPGSESTSLVMEVIV